MLQFSIASFAKISLNNLKTLEMLFAYLCEILRASFALPLLHKKIITQSFAKDFAEVANSILRLTSTFLNLKLVNLRFLQLARIIDVN